MAKCRPPFRRRLIRHAYKLCAGFAVCITWLASAPQLHAQSAQAGQVSGLAIPRFVSLKSDRVNVRGGPNKDHEVTFVYTHAGLPVEITAEFENWRKIRDWEGAEGWVYHSLLSGKRTALVALKAKDDTTSLYDSPATTGAVTAQLQSGVMATIKRCTGTWCRITGNRFEGWIEQDKLWGVYPGVPVE